jgi:hypothetical protein
MQVANFIYSTWSSIGFNNSTHSANVSGPVSHWRCNAVVFGCMPHAMTVALLSIGLL